MESTNHSVFNLIILDESGSMKSIKEPTISGFNEVVETIKMVEQKFPTQKHFISLVSFNSGGINEIVWNEEVSKLEKINEKNYQPNYGTPLYDAIGFSVNKLKHQLPEGSSYNVLVTILTDGEENASKEFNAQTIKTMIEELKTNSWTFAYIGANHDVIAAARKLSITSTLHFEANKASVKAAFSADKKARIQMAESTVLFSKNNFNENYFTEDEVFKNNLKGPEIKRK